MRIWLIILIIVVIMLVVVYFTYRYLSRDIHSVTELFNKFLQANCSDPAIFDPKAFAWTQNFRDEWRTIRTEFFDFSRDNNIPLHKQVSQSTASCDVDNKWRALFLRAFGRDTDFARLFPVTMELINKCPCTLAYFSILEPGAKLKPHVGIYKGVIRYHLGLVVPADRDNCFLSVDNKTLNWDAGHDLMFDDMFMHHAENNTTEPRIILFLDIQRDFHNVFINTLNTLMLRFIRSNDVLTDALANINSHSRSHPAHPDFIQ